MYYFMVLTLLWGVLVSGLAEAQPVSLRDKIGQMLIIGFEGHHVDEHSTIVKAIRDDNIGGVVLFDYNPKTKRFDKNIESPLQVRQLNADLQEANHKAQLNHHRPLLPLFISVDYEGGEKGTRLNSNIGFPETVTAAIVGRTGDVAASRVAKTMATTLEDSGFNLNFAPVLDVNVNPDNPIIGKLGRSFSENPNEVVKYASIFSYQFLHHNVQCAYKHFPGHGSSTGDSHLGFVDVSDTWRLEELEPYEQLLGQDDACGMVMTAHLVNRQLDKSGLPATLSYKILTELLRHRLHFNGVIITDDMQMKAITDHYSLEKAVTLAVNAGVDMFIFGNQLSDIPQDPKKIIDLIEAKVKSGEISEQRINEAYQHIKAMKKTLQ